MTSTKLKLHHKSLLVLPVFILILIGVVDLGRAVWQHNSISNAAREGARFGIVLKNPDGTTRTDAQITDVVKDKAVGVDITSEGAVVISFPEGRTAEKPITVTVAYQYQLVTPIISAVIPGGVINLSATSKMNAEF